MIRFFLPALSALALSLCSLTSAPSKPNIVLVLIDDLGYFDVGAYGSEVIDTPHIDVLAASGLQMTQAYATAAVCSPSRAGIMTGRHNLELGIWNAAHRVEPGTLIYPKILSNAGYQTWHLGKWHMGRAAAGTSPEDLGFEIGLGGDESWDPGSHFWPYRSAKLPNHPGLRVPDFDVGGVDGEYLADRLTDEAIQLIENRDPERPFYLNLWHYGVHTPHEAKPELIAKYKERLAALPEDAEIRSDPVTGARYQSHPNSATYCAMVESIDDSVGKLVGHLKEIGEYENTLFIFYSDNGPVNSAAIYPLRGYKNSLYEGGVRVPAIFAWPGKIDPGVSDERIWTLDLFKTILEAADVALPDDFAGEEGQSLIPMLTKGESVEPRDFYWYFPEDRLGWGQRASAVLYSKTGFKYHLFFQGDSPELYDMREDQSEFNSVLARHPEIAQELRKQLTDKIKAVYQDLPAPPAEYMHLVPQIEETLGIEN